MLLTSLLTCALLVRHACPQRLPAEVDRDIDLMARDLLNCRRITGMSLSVVKDGEVVKSSGYGYLDEAGSTEVNGQTLFGIASLTKAFTVTLLEKLISESNGRWSWNTKVKDVIGPNFRFNDTLRTEHATLGDLASHRLGLYGHNQLRQQDNLDRRLLAEKIRFIPAKGRFRETFFYNNLLYGVLTYVAEKMGKASWEELTQKHLFDPLEMGSTTFSHLMNKTTKNVATSYLESNGTKIPVPLDFHGFWGKLGGSGSIVSSSDDMAKWMKFHLTGGKDARGRQLIPAKALRDTYTRRVVSSKTVPRDQSYFMRPIAPITYTRLQYGRGWRRGYYRGYRQISHTGSSYGFQSLLTLMPDLRLGIHVNTNSLDPHKFARKLIHSYIIDRVMNFDPWLNRTTACTFPEPWAPLPKPDAWLNIRKDLSPTLPLLQYVGTYGSLAYGNVTVSVVNDTLYLRYGKYGLWYLYANGVANTFDGELEQRYRYAGRDLFNVTFTGSGSAMDHVTLTSMQRRQAPRFTRGLRYNPHNRFEPPPTGVAVTIAHARTSVYAYAVAVLIVFSIRCLV